MGLWLYDPWGSGAAVYDDMLENPRWRIALWTLLVEVVGLAAGLAVPGFLLLVFSNGCMSPGVSSRTEPQAFDPVLAIGGLALAGVVVVTAVKALRLLFASERGDGRRVRWLQVQLLVQLGLILTIVVLTVSLRDPHGVSQCYRG